MTDISAKERQERARALANTRATLRMSGFDHASPEANAIFERYVDGALTLAEMGAAIDELHERRYGPLRLPRNKRPTESA